MFLKGRKPERRGRLSRKEVALSYPQQALSQNRVQFWVTLIAASLVLGFGIYLIGVAAYGYLVLGQSLQVTAIETLLSIILDAVSVLFFRQLNETRKHSVQIYDRMRFDQRVTEAIKLSESIDDLSTRSATKAKLVLLLVKTEDLSITRSGELH